MVRTLDLQSGNRISTILRVAKYGVLVYGALTMELGSNPNTLLNYEKAVFKTSRSYLSEGRKSNAASHSLLTMAPSSSGQGRLVLNQVTEIRIL